MSIRWSLCLSADVFHYLPPVSCVPPTLSLSLLTSYPFSSASSEGFPMSRLIYLETKFLIDSAFRKTNHKTASGDCGITPTRWVLPCAKKWLIARLFYSMQSHRNLLGHRVQALLTLQLSHFPTSLISYLLVAAYFPSIIVNVSVRSFPSPARCPPDKRCVSASNAPSLCQGCLSFSVVAIVFLSARKCLYQSLSHSWGDVPFPLLVIISSICQSGAVPGSACLFSLSSCPRCWTPSNEAPVEDAQRGKALRAANISREWFHLSRKGQILFCEDSWGDTEEPQCSKCAGI